jgi:uncharacterized protein with gpF-like domain
MPRRPRTQARPGETRIKAVRPSAAIGAAYSRRLKGLVKAMHDDVVKQITAAYEDTPPLAIAEDKLPVREINALFKHLSRKWVKRINDGADALAGWFTQSVKNRSDTALRRILRDAGISVRFQTNRAMLDAMAAASIDNVALIKSIPQQYLGKVQGAVMRSASIGGDVGALTKELSTGYGITARRAAFIASDQNRKLTAVVMKCRQADLGCTHAIWRHSHAAHEPRPSHLAFDGHRYEIAKGAYLEDVGGKWAWVWPGTAIRCGCVSESLIPGVNDQDEAEAA